MDINVDLVQQFINFLITKLKGIKNESILDKELAEELHKSIIRKFNERKLHLLFKNNIWGADLTDMQFISKFKKGFRFLLCFIDIYSKYYWVFSLKDKKV